MAGMSGSMKGKEELGRLSRNDTRAVESKKVFKVYERGLNRYYLSLASIFLNIANWCELALCRITSPIHEKRTASFVSH